MISYIGYELSEATELLTRAGYKVVALEVRSKKGVENYNSKRVIRQGLIDEKTVELCFSCVLTIV